MKSDQVEPKPFFFEGGPIGVLLIHGYTGSPPEMRLVGEYLHDRGCTVHGPLLPGHGTTPEEMNRCRWQDWTGAVEEALINLRADCEHVFVGGLSMGSLLTLHLAAHHRHLPGAICYSPAVKMADWRIYLARVLKPLFPTFPKSPKSDCTGPEVRDRLWSYDVNPVSAADELLRLSWRVRELLPQVSCPLLVIHSTGDPAIRPDSAPYTVERAGSEDKELVTLHESGHCITIDVEWEDVAEKTHRFIASHSEEGQ